MGKPQRRFTQEFAREAVRLVETSGRTQREIAIDLGIGLSTLRRWIDKRREHEMETPPERQEDFAAELKRLRRENEILRQEHEILKRAATFFAKEGSR
jgi:transposase